MFEEKFWVFLLDIVVFSFCWELVILGFSDCLVFCDISVVRVWRRFIDLVEGRF